MLLPGRQLRNLPASALSRLLWASMLILHVPALIASWSAIIQAGPDLNRLDGYLLLNLSVVFFALKLRGVAFLEFKTNRRSLVAAAVAVALMHADAIGARLDIEAVPAELPVAAGALFTAGLARVQSAIGSALDCGHRLPKRRNRAISANEAVIRGAFAPHLWILSTRQCIPRAPPA